MKMYYKWLLSNAVLLLLCGVMYPAQAQTEQDALMMPKNNLCVALSYGYSSWTNYWEGTLKRNNDNIGALSTQSATLMLNYGITNNLNLLAAIPYISVNASKGTLQGLNGFQDINLFVKWKPVASVWGNRKFSVFAVGGYSTPSNNYNIDFMPMCVGLGSKVLSGRLTADYQRNKLFATLSGAYMLRGNVRLDREAYYTTRQINSSEVYMPNAGNFLLMAGYRSRTLIAQAFMENMTTFGGFDIRRNDMPFVSNRMNSTKAGLEAKYYVPRNTALGFHANAWRTLSGRNVGESTGFMAGIDYAFKLSKHTIGR
ncbi:hypothetical protein [Mucilaginibacter lacusdianchii]|uniref:hypothetical protein n=1 Tax=Mucilaginibacter lacusdianchii TaxID=2684211 RepID=UPI00131B6861|nr:hypothetical protein [Mucilaginibacter sp. JXJ CY 39]